MCDMDCFIRECDCFFSMINDREVIYFCLFAFEFFKQCVNIVLQHVLAFAIETKIALARDTCLDFLLLLDFMIYMQVTLEGLWVK